MRKPQGKIKSSALAKRVRRKLAIRKKIEGTTERPRVAIVRSNKNLSVQVIDDSVQKTLFAVNSFGKNGMAVKANKDGAKSIGEKVAEKLKEKNVSQCVYDRSGYKYHGVVAAVAESLRENGIQV
jgi:large subunit ribosomal protein L18